MMNNQCYTNYDIDCQIIDNQLFKTYADDPYELLLNPASGCCVNSKYAKTSKLFGRTFIENDPLRMMLNGYPASAAGWETKVDAGYFQPEICNETPASVYNTENLNLYQYQLSSTLTEYITAETDIKTQTISSKRKQMPGELWCRNTLSTEIQRIQDLLPTLRNFPEIYSDIVNYDIVYDTVVIYTTKHVYVDRLKYDHKTGMFVTAEVEPIVFETSGDDNVGHAFHYLNELDNSLTFAKVENSSNGAEIEMYRYDLDTGNLSISYGTAAREADKLVTRLADDLHGKYDLYKISQPHLTYNETINKYTLTFVGRLSATSELLLSTAGTEYQGSIFSLYIYNFKQSSAGMDLIDCIVYHPDNKRQYDYREFPTSRLVNLKGRGYRVKLDHITDAQTSVTIDPKLIAVRESKLKEIRYKYNDQLIIKSRLPVNDMYSAGLTDIMNMVESYRGHGCGGPIDFACPRYQTVSIDLDLNLSQVSTTEIIVEAIYYDGHVEQWYITTEARPLPIDVLLKEFNLIDTKSYTTETNTNLLKLQFESQEPSFISEFIIKNNGSREEFLPEAIELLSTGLTSLSTVG